MQHGNLNYLPAELKEVSIDLIKTLSVLANHHILKNRLDKAYTSVKKARIFLDMIPVYEGDLQRINAEMQLSIVNCMLYKDRPKEQAEKLHFNVQEYQKPGVEIYLILIFHFVLVVSYLKDGNSIQFFNRCKILKGLVMNILECKLTIPTENIRISQVIRLKMMNYEYLNKDVFCGIICFSILLEWISRRLTKQDDAKTKILLANSRALAQDHSHQLIASVNNIAQLIEEQIEKIDHKQVQNGQAEGGKSNRKLYSINVIDYDKGKCSSLPSTRPVSVSRRSSFRVTDNQNGSGTKRHQGSKLVVNATLAEEPTAADTARSRYSIKKRWLKETKRPQTARDQIQSALFDSEQTQKVQFQEKTEKIEQKDQLDQDYQTYSTKKKEASLSTDKVALVKHVKGSSSAPKYEKLGYLLPKKKKKNFKKESQEYLTFGSYYLGLYTLKQHLEEPLVLEKAQELVEQELHITKKNSNDAKLKVLDISEIQHKDISPLSKQKKFSLRKLMRSGTSYGNIQPEKNEATNEEQNLFSSFGIKNAEMLLLNRPSTSAGHSLNFSSTISKRKDQKFNLMRANFKQKESVKTQENKEINLTEKSFTVGTQKTKKEEEIVITKELTSREVAEKRAEKRAQLQRNLYKFPRERSVSETQMNIHHAGGSFREQIDTNRTKRLSVVGNVYKVPVSGKDLMKKKKSTFSVNRPSIHPDRTNQLELQDDRTITGRNSILPIMTEEGKEETSKNDQSSKIKSNSSKNKLYKTNGGQGTANNLNLGGNTDYKTEGNRGQNSDQSSSKNDIHRQSAAQISIEKDKKDFPKLNLVSIENSPANSTRHIGLPEDDQSISPKQKLAAVATSTNKLLHAYKETNIRRGSVMAQPSRKDSMFHKQNILPTEEEHDSSEEKTPKSNFFKGNRNHHRGSLFIPVEAAGSSHKNPEILEEIKEQDGTLGSPNLSNLLEKAADLDLDQSGGFRLQDLLRNEKTNFWENARYLRDNLQIKQDLLRFVKGFHLINDFYKKRRNRTLRMAYFVIWFFPDAMMIKKPREGLDQYESMLDYPEDYEMDEMAELGYRPW